jgi:hypothetical protein
MADSTPSRDLDAEVAGEDIFGFELGGFGAVGDLAAVHGLSWRRAHANDRLLIGTERFRL